MVKFVDRVKLNLTTTGTGTVTFGSVVDGFQSLADASVVDADVVRYAIESGNNYEVGTGTIGLAGGTYTMARSPSSSSESDNSAINLGSGAVCFLTMLAEDVVQVLADLDNVSSTSPAGGQTLSWNAGTGSWSPASPSGGITSVGNYAGLPASPNETDLAWVQDTKALYIYDGAEWDRFSTGSQFAPRFTTAPPATLTLSKSGAVTTMTTVAVDDAGFPITYDWDAFDSSGNVYKDGTLPNMITAITETSGAFAMTPSTNTAHAGDLTFRTKASDGVATLVGLTTLKLIFTDYVAVPALTRNYSNRTTQLASSTSYVSVTSTRSVTTYGGPYQGPLKDGKYYTEITFDTGQYYSSATYNSFVLGCYDRAFIDVPPNSFGSNTTTPCWSGFFPERNGIKISRGNTVGSNNAFTSPYPTISGSSNMNRNGNDRIMAAWDTTAKKVWWGLNGVWSNNGTEGTDSTGDPVTGAGIALPDLGLSTGASTTGSFCFYFCCQVGTFNLRMQIYAGEANNLAYSVPTGFNRQ